MKRLYFDYQDRYKYICSDKQGNRYIGTAVKKEGLDWGVVCLDLHQTFEPIDDVLIGEVHIDGVGNVVWAENKLWAELEVKSA